MPRLSTISNKLTTAGFKKSPVVVKIYTGTDFTAAHSTWTFSTGTLSLKSSTLPYHSYGNLKEPTTATNQLTNKTWPMRAGPTLSTSTLFSYNVTAILTTVTFTATVVASTITVATTLTDEIIVLSVPDTTGLTATTAISFDRSVGGLTIGEIYYIRDLNVNGPRTFSVAASTSSNAIVLASIGTGTATIAGIPKPSQNIGYWINGVNIRNSSADRESPNGYLLFSNLDYVASYKTALQYSYDLNQDLAGGRTVNDGSYAYHDYSFASAWTTGIANVGNTGTAVTTGTAEITLIPYLDNSLVHYDGHSKILGWSLDGYPIYGPYGYSLPLDCNSLIIPMASGYKTYDMPGEVIARVIDGVLDTRAYPLGIFVQDYYYAGIGNLDLHNGRYCVTPEYPNGTYAYFCSLDATTLIPSYPYVIGNVFKSLPVGPGQTTSNLTNGGGSAPKQTI